LFYYTSKIAKNQFILFAKAFFKDNNIGFDFSLKEWKQERTNLPSDLPETVKNTARWGVC